MKRIISKCIVIFLLVTIGGTVVLAQEWSAEQKEALGITQKMVKYWVDRDIDGYMSCLHDNFIGWLGEDPLPLDKNSLRHWEVHWLSTVNIIREETKPVSINVTGDVAIITTYSTELRQDENGNKLTYGKWTFICKKENGKWLIIGLFGGRINE